MIRASVLLALTLAQWQSDISYLQTELPKRHPNLFFELPRAEFIAALDEIKARAGDRSDIETLIAIQRVVARIGDAHTEVDIRRAPQTFYPLGLYRFDDGIYVIRTNAESRAACGAKLLAIDGVDAEEVYDRVASVISHENDSWVAARFASPMVRAETLAALGLTGGRFTFERFELELTPGPGVLAPPPLPNYSYTYDLDRKLLHVKYNVCANDPAKPFDAFAKEVFAIADREQVDWFVVDVRNNSGGNTSVAKPLIDGLVLRSHFRGRLYVVIGRETFSSGLLNALDLKSRAGAIVVGEPSGGKPNSYGEVRSFTLPASGATVFHSTKLFKVVPGDPSSLEPDVPVRLRSRDYFSRRDPMLDAIMGTSAVDVTRSRRRAVVVGRVCD